MKMDAWALLIGLNAFSQKLEHSRRTGRFKIEMNSLNVVVIVCDDSSVFPAQSVREDTPKPNCSLSSSVILSFLTNTRNNRLLARPRHICGRRSDRGTGTHWRRRSAGEGERRRRRRRRKEDELDTKRSRSWENILVLVLVWHVLPHVLSEHRFPAPSRPEEGWRKPVLGVWFCHCHPPTMHPCRIPPCFLYLPASYPAASTPSVSSRDFLLMPGKGSYYSTVGIAHTYSGHTHWCTVYNYIVVSCHCCLCDYVRSLGCFIGSVL